jgi:hypothetical protein
MYTSMYMWAVEKKYGCACPLPIEPLHVVNNTDAELEIIYIYIYIYIHSTKTFCTIIYKLIYLCLPIHRGTYCFTPFCPSVCPSGCHTFVNATPPPFLNGCGWNWAQSKMMMPTCACSVYYHFQLNGGLLSDGLQWWEGVGETTVCGYQKQICSFVCFKFNVPDKTMGLTPNILATNYIRLRFWYVSGDPMPRQWRTVGLLKMSQNATNRRSPFQKTLYIFLFSNEFC